MCMLLVWVASVLSVPPSEVIWRTADPNLPGHTTERKRRVGVLPTLTSTDGNRYHRFKTSCKWQYGMSFYHEYVQGSHVEDTYAHTHKTSWHQKTKSQFLCMFFSFFGSLFLTIMYFTILCSLSLFLSLSMSLKSAVFKIMHVLSVWVAKVVRLLCPILGIYENVRPAVFKSKAPDGTTHRPAIEKVMEDVHSLGYHFVTWFN